MTTQINAPKVERFISQPDSSTDMLSADVSIPPSPRGVILFTHVSGSCRSSPLNHFVASEFHDGGIATVLMDLLTPAEEAIDLQTTECRFDVDLLARRWIATSDWLRKQPQLMSIPMGYFGTGEGAAAAMIAAAERPADVAAIVSWGGRPDLARSAFAKLVAPTLLIVGGDDEQIVRCNELALEHLGDNCQLKILPHATDLFDEPGVIEGVVQIAREWFDLSFALQAAPEVRTKCKKAIPCSHCASNASKRERPLGA